MAQIRKDTIARGPSLFEKSELTLHGFLLAANKSSGHYDETHVRVFWSKYCTREV